MEARARCLFYFLLFLAVATGTVLVLERGPRPRRLAATVAFQKQVGGLGFGAVLDLSGCAFGFDPRLEGACSAADGPLPGGDCFCPRHGGLAPYPPREGELPPAQGGP